MIIAFGIGLFSSLHCLGMCGPLFVAIIFSTENSVFTVINFVLYHIARIFAYMLIGLIPVLFGITYLPVNLQQILAVVSGILILFLIWKKNAYHSNILNKIVQYFQMKSRIGFKKKSAFKYLFLGFSNGLLPCGMVYVALTAAIGNSIHLNPVWFMLFFGFATLPVFIFLFLIRSFSNGVKLLGKIHFAQNILLITIALMLILRGLNLGIPYISPKIQNTKDSCKISGCHE